MKKKFLTIINNMSIAWPEVNVAPDCLHALPRHRTPSSSLRRACRRYIIAMGNLNRQVAAYNTEVLLRQLQGVTSHGELRALLHQCIAVPFVPVPLPALTPAVPHLTALHRAYHCLTVLKDTLDNWQPPPHAAPPPSTTDPVQVSPPQPAFSYFTTTATTL